MRALNLFSHTIFHKCILGLIYKVNQEFIESLVFDCVLFQALLPNFEFCKGDWVNGDFPKMSTFPDIIGLMSFGNSETNLYIQFLVITIQLRFTCGEGKLCQDVKTFKILCDELQKQRKWLGQLFIRPNVMQKRKDLEKSCDRMTSNTMLQDCREDG